jgi:cadmium resistance protein CadD (predicted permease)
MDTITFPPRRSKLDKLLKIVGGVVLGTVLIAVVSFVFAVVVKILWNWLMPNILGLKEITYWQAWGLMVLCGFLFKGTGSK